MIQPLRTRHRRLILIVALTVAVLSVLGIRDRREVPKVERLPGAASTSMEEVEELR